MKVRELIAAVHFQDSETEVEMWAGKLLHGGGAGLTVPIGRLGIAYLTDEGTFEVDNMPEGLGAAATPIICLWPVEVQP